MNDLIDEVKKLENGSNVIEQALKAAAKPVLEDAQRTTAFIDRSGNLRESLVLSKVKSKRSGSGVGSAGVHGKYILVQAKSPHAHLVEYGTSRTKSAHPFLQPALERHKKEAVDIAANILREALK
jgi:HK97 gp10 family phage protein